MTIPFGDTPPGVYLGFGQGLRGLGDIVKLMDQSREIGDFGFGKLSVSPTGRRDRAGLHRSDRYGKPINHAKFPGLSEDVERVGNIDFAPS